MKQIKNMDKKDWGYDNVEDFLKYSFDLTPLPWQIKFVEKCLRQKRVTMIHERRAGKSMIISQLAILLAQVIRPITPIVILVNTELNATLMNHELSKQLLKVKGKYKNFFKIDKKKIYNNRFEFADGSSIIVQDVGRTGEKIRGISAGAVIVDEVQFVPEEVLKERIEPISFHAGRLIEVGSPPFMR